MIVVVSKAVLLAYATSFVGEAAEVEDRAAKVCDWLIGRLRRSV